jgi:signal transduction histidine kinase
VSRAHATPFSKALWLALATVLAGSLLSARASAQAALDVANELHGVVLGHQISLLEDPHGSLSIDQVSGPKLGANFISSLSDVPNKGFTSAAYWIRFEVHNSSAQKRPWLLELAYPLLDDLTLYVPRAAGGFEVKRTGDRRPFKQRDIAYRNFVFSLEEPPGQTRTYYLRAASGGSIVLPLVAWSFKDFVAHQHLDWAVLCIFYGIVLVMACYNGLLYFSTRQREYLPYAAYIFCVGVYEFTRAGHTFQFLFPNQPASVHHLSAASGAAAIMFACSIFAVHAQHGSIWAFVVRYGKAYCAGLIALSWFVPYALSIKLLAVAACVLPLSVLGGSIALLRSGKRQAKLLMLGWTSVLAGTIVAALNAAGLLRSVPLTTWSIEIGVAIQVVLLAAALADKLNTARSELSQVNTALSEKLEAVSSALIRAEEANRRAERATRVRDEFIATMSHEFRTPLNPIINIPQGLRREFIAVRHARCGRCRTDFELEDGEMFSLGTHCPECDALGTLAELSLSRFTGNPTRARSLLRKVEASGLHLLRVVNGILEFSKMEAGQLRLVRERFDLSALVREVVSDMSRAAKRGQISWTLTLAPNLPQIYADQERLRQVVMHLTENAIKFSKAQSRVEISLSLEGEDYLLSIGDQGIGIAEEHLETIFGSFEQVNKGNTRSHGGTGLGLSISRSLVRMHGGELSVRSALGEGSTFVVKIPRSAPESDSFPQTASAEIVIR